MTILNQILGSVLVHSRTLARPGIRAERMDLLQGILSRILGGLSTNFSKFYSVAMGQQPQFTVAVEGNIGSGKTFLLQHFADCPHAEVITEPVNRWRNIGGHNALEALYKDPSRWGMTLQTYVQLTMMQQHNLQVNRPVKLMERSLFSAKYCFVENLYQSKKMPAIEYTILTEWFDWIVESQNVNIDLIVYLRTKPETVYERIKARCRKEETTIPMDYIQALHELHEDWLIHKKNPDHLVPAPVLVLDANSGKVEMIEQYNKHRRNILCGYS